MLEASAQRPLNRLHLRSGRIIDREVAAPEPKRRLTAPWDWQGCIDSGLGGPIKVVNVAQDPVDDSAIELRDDDDKLLESQEILGSTYPCVRDNFRIFDIDDYVRDWSVERFEGEDDLLKPTPDFIIDVIRGLGSYSVQEIFSMTPTKFRSLCPRQPRLLLDALYCDLIIKEQAGATNVPKFRDSSNISASVWDELMQAEEDLSSVEENNSYRELTFYTLPEEPELYGM